MQKKEYSLFTAITMIIGTVIGSGIFFKSDNILIYTNGSIKNGIILFSLAAIGIIFGSLAIGVLASKTTKAGGLITYADEFSSKKTACAFGWFQVFIYYPAVIVVVSWVVGVYISMLFGINATYELTGLIGLVAAIIYFGINALSANLGGYFQNCATIIKMIPLIIIATAGFIFGDPHMAMPITEKLATSSSVNWLAALGPIAFSYDGWVVSTSIAHEIKNSKRNLPIALIVGPIFVLAAYIFYFAGISFLIGPANIIELGDQHVNVAAIKLFGEMGAKVILIFVIISVLGTLNGFILGFIRLPYSLALRGMFPMEEKLKKVNEKTQLPEYSALIAFLITCVWEYINYIVQKHNLIPNSDVSEIPVVASYVLYIILYVCVIKLYLKGEVEGKIRGIIIPILAIFGSLLIVIGGLQNPMTILYFGICLIVIFISLLFWKRKNN
ncbi:APC family permease [Fusobacterium sp.]|uniref:APC family permease n=1 Tax=Fusobacterium sp. TaxID=68766 RepID=UPI00262F8470|nr:APC family permease [Fusobacterium sp.]